MIYIGGVTIILVINFILDKYINSIINSTLIEYCNVIYFTMSMSTTALIYILIIDLCKKFLK